ncbi:uncharacterized protein [Musca autumnalis]|uniref:uncharacterized protein n=1 Tax=Musca autumnalis TaxID=221902 RepID=UPI003CF76A71
MFANSIKTRSGPTSTAVSNVKRQRLDSEAENKWNGNSSKPLTRSAATSKHRNDNPVTKSKLPGPTKTILQKRPTNDFNNKRRTLLSNAEVKKELITKKPPSKPMANKKSLGPATQTKLPSAANRLNSSNKPQWNRNNASSSSLGWNSKHKDCKSLQNLSSDTAAIAIQTQEDEILNHSLIVGDMKFLNPSKHIVAEIERSRKDLKNKQMLKTKRTFPEHSAGQEEHISDLNEFLEKSYVSKKKTPRKSRDTYEENQKLFKTMDQLLNREIPKTESIADIRARIKRKEEELLNLFDNVESTARLLINNGN